MRTDAPTRPALPAGKKLALITGGAKRLGAHLARTLARDGWAVVINYRSSEAAASLLVDDIGRDGGYARAVRADVGDKVDVASMFASVEQVEGRLDLLVNNVGVYEPKPLPQVTPEDWDHHIQANLSGAYYCCYSALPLLQQTQGSIVNIGYAGVDVLNANPNATAYEVSKVGLLVLTKAIAASYGPHGVRANMLSPGHLANSIDLPDDLDAEIPMRRAGTLEDMAQALRYVIGADYVTGQNIDVAGGYRL